MENIDIFYEGNLRTRAVHLRSRSELLTDAPVDNEGKGEAFSPTDLLATSLGTCVLTIMAIAAQKRGFCIEGAVVNVRKQMAAQPRRISEIVLDFTFPAKNYSSEEKAILENAAKSCPVSKSLHPDLIQNFHFHFEEAPS